MVRKKNDIFGSIYYYNEQDQLHREDGPSVEYVDGHKEWYINGLRHRIDGPAREFTDGYKDYYLMDKYHYYEDWLAIKDYPLLW